MEAEKILEIAANALNEKKAKEMSAIDVSDLTSLTRYFLIVTANSSTQVRAFADEVEEKLEEAGLRPHHIEGKTTGWIAMDYQTVIVHIFLRDQREFYGLDKMWSDGKHIDLSTILVNAQED